MPLLIDPPPQPAMPPQPVSGGRWPNAALAHGGSDTISAASQGQQFDILGRAGNPATVQQRNTVLATLWNTPPQDPLGSWTLMNWFTYVGRGGGRWANTPFVTFEFRSQAEVEAAAAGTHGFTPFAVTLWNQDINGLAAGSPPIDGASYFGWTYDAANFTGIPLARVLIREDLDTGGAGAAWDGTKFLAECIQHELGHVAQFMLMSLYGDSYVADNACNLFGRPSSAWANPALDWEDRVIEASAETFKDVMFPARRYDNRTHIALPQERFDDFKRLFVDYSENPYWEATNIATPGYSPDESTYIQYFVNGAGNVLWHFMSDSVAAALTTLQEPPYGPPGGLLKLPVNGTFKLGWNFDTTEYDPGSPDWSSYNPQTEARVKYGMTLYGAGPWDPLAFQDVEINANDPATGTETIVVPEGALPTDEFLGGLRFPGEAPWEFPLVVPGLPDNAILPPGLVFVQPDYTRPWAWVLAERARPPIRRLPWPYIVPSLHLGNALQSTQRLDVRLVAGGAVAKVPR